MGFGALLLAAHAASALPTADYDAKTGRINLEARDDPLEDVLMALADAVGCSLTARADLSPGTRIRMTNAPLPRVLDRVLGEFNYDYVLLYEDGRPSQIKIYASDGVPSKMAAATPPDRRGRAQAGRGGRAQPASVGATSDLADSPLLNPASTRLQKAREIKRLAGMGDPAAIQILIESLQVLDSSGLRMGVLAALGDSGDPRAVEALGEVLADAQRPATEKIASVQALADLGFQSAQALLREVAAGVGPEAQLAGALAGLETDAADDGAATADAAGTADGAGPVDAADTARAADALDAADGLDAADALDAAESLDTGSQVSADPSSGP